MSPLSRKGCPHGGNVANYMKLEQYIQYGVLGSNGKNHTSSIYPALITYHSHCLSLRFHM